MQGELSFVPKILLCGDEAEFFSRVGKRPFNIVGRVKFSGDVDGQPLNFLRDGKIFFNGTVQHFTELIKNIEAGKFDYVVFNSLDEFNVVQGFFLTNKFWSKKIVTLELFKSLPQNFFYDSDSEFQLLAFLKNLSVKTLLDVDAYFSQGKIFTKLENDFTEIDCISETPPLPVMENIYAHAYQNFAEVGFKRYDAALIVERTPTDFISMFTFLENFSDCVITFVRNGSELEKYIVDNVKIFSQVNALKSMTGTWFLLRRRKAHENFCMYVITHKPAPHEDNLPAGYRIIHAGRALNDDLGYLGDDTGDNISRLNPYLNELTALYWFWRNADDSVVGLSHYRRFFTESNDTNFAYDKILTRDAALKILERYDMIIKRIVLHHCSQYEAVVSTSGKDLTDFAASLIRKHLVRIHPEYLDAFNFMLISNTLYGCNMFVTRRNIFDAYCKWLFSFFIDATEELLRTINFDNLPSGQRRIMGFFAERMLQVWLMKNRLRLKEMNGMFIKDL